VKLDNQKIEFYLIFEKVNELIGIKYEWFIFNYKPTLLAKSKKDPANPLHSVMEIYFDIS